MANIVFRCPKEDSYLPVNSAEIGGRFDETTLATVLVGPHHSRVPKLSLLALPRLRIW